MGCHVGPELGITNTMAKKNTKLDDALKRRGLNMLNTRVGLSGTDRDTRKEHNKQCGIKMRLMAGRRVDTGLMGLMDEEDCRI